MASLIELAQHKVVMDTNSQRLTTPQLLDYANRVIHKTLNSPNSPSNLILYRAYSLAQLVIEHFLGADWLVDNVYAARSGGPNFLGRDCSTPDGRDEHLLLVTCLGEMLHNLQHKHGFDECISKLKAEQIEATYAELETAKLLFIHGVRFKFVRPAPPKTYDLELKYTAGPLIAAETKCKLESGPFSKKTILNTLRNARAQLPRDMPGFIFLRVHPRWFSLLRGSEHFRDAIADFYKARNTRTASIKVFTLDICFGVVPGHTTSAYLIDERDNPNCKFTCTSGWSMLRRPIYPNRWVEFLKLGCFEGKFITIPLSSRGQIV